MGKHRGKISFLIIMFIFLLGIKDVSAATFSIDTDKKYCYTKSGEYDKTVSTGTNCPYYGTYYKEVGGKEAYCVQAKQETPKDGATCKAVSYGNTAYGTTWNQTRALRAAKIISIIDKEYNGAKKHVYIFSALNEYLNFDSNRNFSNSVINKAIETAKGTTFNTSKDTIKGSITNNGWGNGNGGLQKSNSGYYYDTINLTFKNTYTDSESITFKPTCTNCKIYTNSAMTTEYTGTTVNEGKEITKTLYVKATKTDIGTEVSLNFEMTATSEYSIAKLWNCGSGKQAVLTVTSQEFPHEKTKTFNSYIPDPTITTIRFQKINSAGAKLPGATVKLTIGSETFDITSTNYSQSIDKYEEGQTVTYSINEITAPTGYKLATPLENVQWTIGTTKTETCYERTGEDGEWNKTNNNDTTGCKNNFSVQGQCYYGDEPYEDSAITDQTSCEELNNQTEDDGETGTEQVEPLELETDTTPKYEWKPYCHNDTTNQKMDSMEYCTNNYMLVETSGNNLFIEYTNSLNHVSFQKVDNDGNLLEGAALKVCTSDDYKQNNNNCTAIKTVEGEELSWISGLSTKTFYGIAIGDYYLVEESPALGYIINNEAIGFNMDEKGTVTLLEDNIGKIDEEDGAILLTNKINEFKISKTDIATSKELPGATISICLAHQDETTGDYEMTVSDEGECSPAKLANNEEATWVSTNEPHEIRGLAAGTYYLVERIAPTNYSTAESILFKINEDGVLLDINDNPLENNKIIMQDKLIEQVPTGDLPILMIIVIGFTGLATGAICYRYSNKKYGLI